MLPGDEAHGDAGGDAVEAQQQRHGSGEVLTVAGLGVEEEGRIRESEAAGRRG